VAEEEVVVVDGVSIKSRSKITINSFNNPTGVYHPMNV
jgi:hypothetical protein